jgi:hypothetical protein
MWNRIQNRDINVFEMKKKKGGDEEPGFNWQLTTDSNLG